jgi:hypothetical protein
LELSRCSAGVGRTHNRSMTSSAPRYDRRLLKAIRRLDDERLPIAETCRRVGRAAAEMGLPRPSYVHLRRIVVAERELRRARREIASDLVRDVAGGLAPRVDRAVTQAREANVRAERLRQS